jgi:hypothetical protein
MISEPTQKQLQLIKIAPQRPLLICDVDDVIVDFIADFRSFLGPQGFDLKPSPRSFHGEIVDQPRGQFIGEAHTITLIDAFFASCTHAMRPISGAVESLLTIGETATVVLLTNAPHEAGDMRRENMKALGLPFPVVTNSGPKAAAIDLLARQTTKPTAFIDDSPFFISSTRERLPHVPLVHFLHNLDFAKHAPVLDYVSLRTHTWTEARPHLLELLASS